MPFSLPHDKVGGGVAPGFIALAKTFATVDRHGFTKEETGMLQWRASPRCLLTAPAATAKAPPRPDGGGGRARGYGGQAFSRKLRACGSSSSTPSIGFTHTRAEMTDKLLLLPALPAPDAPASGAGISL